MLPIVIVGAGIFGVTAALSLRERGHAVTLVDPGPLPHPLAASTDISKVVRMEYGQDAMYMALMEEAREGWLAWNEAWVREGGEPLYHETGVVMVCRAPMAPGGFEYESHAMLRRRGHAPERVDAAALAARFPAWATGRYVDGFFHAKGGYAESGRVVAALLASARRAGVTLRAGLRVEGLVMEGARVAGVRCTGGVRIPAGTVVVAAGAWTGPLVGLGPALRATGHPVFHLRPKDPAPFRPACFPVFTADVARTGYYGFPLNRDGVVKVANHGVGQALDPDAPRVVTPADEARLRAFLAETFPALADAEVVYTRRCLYADTQDEDFWIAPDPDRPGLVVASGGSGHGFKFAPVLGRLIADVVEGRPSPYAERFRWRPEVRLAHGREAARCHEAPER